MTPEIQDDVPMCSARCPALRVVHEGTPMGYGGSRFGCSIDPHGMGDAPLGGVCLPMVRSMRRNLVAATLDYGQPQLSTSADHGPR